VKKPTTIRLSPTVHEMAARAAEEEGVSLSSYIREAVLYRVTYRRAIADIQAGAQGEYDTLNGLLKELGYKLPEGTIAPPYSGVRPRHIKD